MKFKVGDTVKTNIDDDLVVPIGTIGIVVQIDEEAKLYPYQVKLDSGKLYWYSGNGLDHFSEGGEEAEMPKQKDPYDFNNMTDDDLDRLIREAYEALMIRRKRNLMRRYFLDECH